MPDPGPCCISTSVFESLRPRVLLLSQLLFAPGAWLSLLLFHGHSLSAARSGGGQCSAGSQHVRECECGCVACGSCDGVGSRKKGRGLPCAICRRMLGGAW